MSKACKVYNRSIGLETGLIYKPVLIKKIPPSLKAKIPAQVDLVIKLGLEVDKYSIENLLFLKLSVGSELFLDSTLKEKDNRMVRPYTML